jgi:hypothetical protein
MSRLPSSSHQERALAQGRLPDIRLDDEERRALASEFLRLYAEQRKLKARDDLDAWRRHIAALADYNARVERWRTRN